MGRKARLYRPSVLWTGLIAFGGATEESALRHEVRESPLMGQVTPLSLFVRASLT